MSEPAHAMQEKSTPTRADRRKGVLYGCIAAISYGMNPVCALYLYGDGINTNSVLFYRFAISIVLLGGFMALRRIPFGINRHEAGVLALLGVLFAVSSITYFLSFHYMGAGVAATLVFSYPVMVALIMCLCFGERLKWPSLAAIAMTTAGIALLYRDDSGKPIATAGVIIVLLSALAYALYIVAVNRSRIIMPSTKLTFYALLGCLACIAAYAECTSTGELQWLTTPRQWAFATLLALVPTVVSLLFMTMAIRKIGSTATAVMGALEPVTAIFLGMVLFGEAVTPRISAGVILILVAVMCIILDARLRHALSANRIVKRGRLVWKRWHWK